MDYLLLREKITADHAQDMPGQIALALNEKNIASLVPIQTSEITSYLIVTGKWLAIKDSTLPECRLTVDTLNVFETLRVQIPNIRSVLVARIDELVTGGFLTAADKAYIIGLGNVLRSWADINWEGPVTIWQIKEAMV